MDLIITSLCIICRAGCWRGSHQNARISIRIHIACELNVEKSLELTEMCRNVIGAKVFSPQRTRHGATGQNMRVIRAYISYRLRHFQAGASKISAGGMARSNIILASKTRERQHAAGPGTTGLGNDHRCLICIGMH